jgi:hypothetical protein
MCDLRGPRGEEVWRQTMRRVQEELHPSTGNPFDYKSATLPRAEPGGPPSLPPPSSLRCASLLSLQGYT